MVSFNFPSMQPTSAGRKVLVAGFLLCLVSGAGASGGGGSLFGTLIESIERLESSLDTVADYLGGADGCRYKCADGTKPEPNPTHKPSSNGCGSLGFHLNTELFEPMTACCDKHDLCYDRCNKDKDKCDAFFKACLARVCRQVGSLKQLETECLNMVELVHATVTSIGCKAYKDAQKNACVCSLDPARGRIKTGTSGKEERRRKDGLSFRTDL